MIGWEVLSRKSLLILAQTLQNVQALHFFQKKSEKNLVVTQQISTFALQNHS